jgi:hypothetical protein
VNIKTGFPFVFEPAGRFMTQAIDQVQDDLSFALKKVSTPASQSFLLPSEIGILALPGQ